ncbi:hypothetical protein L6V77_30960 [Myxococcota bacterium]|nr:hypothetical protein [Myxococcota bacterium]
MKLVRLIAVTLIALVVAPHSRSRAESVFGGLDGAFTLSGFDYQDVNSRAGRGFALGGVVESLDRSFYGRVAIGAARVTSSRGAARMSHPELMVDFFALLAKTRGRETVGPNGAAVLAPGNTLFGLGVGIQHVPSLEIFVDLAPVCFVYGVLPLVGAGYFVGARVGDRNVLTAKMIASHCASPFLERESAGDNLTASLDGPRWELGGVGIRLTAWGEIRMANNSVFLPGVWSEPTLRIILAGVDFGVE